MHLTTSSYNQLVCMVAYKYINQTMHASQTIVVVEEKPLSELEFHIDIGPVCKGSK